MKETEANIKWREALRSGKYPQGQCFLQDYSGGYCCLGVARVAVFNGVCQPNETDLDDDELIQLGLVGEHPRHRHDQSECMDMNDRGDGMTFEQIAAVIDIAIAKDIPVGKAHQEWEVARDAS